MSDRIELLQPLEPPTEELLSCELRIRAPISAERMWTRHLTPGDRMRLGDDLEKAYYRFGTAGMWMQLHGVTRQKAVVDVAKKLGFLSDGDYEWLLRETGEVVEVEEAVSRAVASGDFVLVESPREAYWRGEKIEIDWYRHNALWEFLWEAGYRAKAGQPIDAFTFGENGGSNVVTRRKSRLRSMREFPNDLLDLLECDGRGTQRLTLPRKRIHVFEQTGVETLAEWTP